MRATLVTLKYFLEKAERNIKEAEDVLHQLYKSQGMTSNEACILAKYRSSLVQEIERIKGDIDAVTIISRFVKD